MGRTMNRSEVVERAFLKFLSGCFKAIHEDLLVGWATAVTQVGPVNPLVQNEELVEAITRQWRIGRVTLRKVEGAEYSKHSDLTEFFYHGHFKAALTDVGKVYLEDLELEKPDQSGFLQKG
jgi:hypothetical protein